MAYMTIEEQIESHLAFLKQQNFAVNELHIDSGFVRCNQAGQNTGRGELCYQTKTTRLDRGLVGLATWLRGEGGKIKIHKTYGLPDAKINNSEIKCEPTDGQNESLEKARAFWEMSDQIGEAEYLLKKGVGYYGIRFRQNDYGKIAVVPLQDITGKLLSYQLINDDGSKRFAQDVETKGLFHMLHQPIAGRSIGLSESYTTAASCFEITGLAMVTAFSTDNLKKVAGLLRRKFPNNPIIVFGDNDRHLKDNKGREAAYSVLKELGKECQVAIPEFEGYPATREFTDWNDYIREYGVKAARVAIQKSLTEEGYP